RNNCKNKAINESSRSKKRSGRTNKGYRSGSSTACRDCKALSKEVKLLILDEPTAALNEEESENLLKLLLEFKKQGMTSILISHKLKELFKVADSITVLRDGKTVRTYHINEEEVSENKVIKDMVGRDLSN